MTKRLTMLVTALAAASLLAVGVGGAAQAAKHTRHAAAHVNKHRTHGTAASTTAATSGQAGDQNAPDPAGEVAEEVSAGENSPESAVSDGPGGHEDGPGASEDHQYEGEE